jgi:hypothetical protein
MSLSTLFLALFVFLQSAALLGWFSVSSVVLGVVGLVFVIIVVVEGVQARSVASPFHRNV